MLFPARTITMDAALRDLGSPDPRVRVAAADALGDVSDDGDRDRAVAALTAALDDPQAEVRTTAAFALGALGVAAAVVGLVDRLEDGDSRVRQACAVALGRIGDARAFAPLVAKLRAGPPDLRYQAALSLAEIDPDRAFDPLVAAVGDDDAEVRANVAAALGLVGDRRAAGWLVELLTDRRRDTRFEAACALARLRDARAVETLTAFVRDQDYCWRAIDALEWTGEPRAASPLAAEMRRIFSGRLLRTRAAAALLVLDPGHADATYARQLLRKAAAASRPDLRGLAEEALARLDGAPPAPEAHDGPAGR